MVAHNERLVLPQIGEVVKQHSLGTEDEMTEKANRGKLFAQ